MLNGIVMSLGLIFVSIILTFIETVVLCKEFTDTSQDGAMLLCITNTLLLAILLILSNS